MAISETFGRADKPGKIPEMDGFNVWTSERSGSFYSL